MRYSVKIFTLNERDDAKVTEAIRTGLLRDAERTSGFTQGTADEKSIVSMAELGLDTLSVEPLPEAPATSRPLASMLRSIANSTLAPLGINSFGARSSRPSYELERADGQRNYLLAKIVGSLTPGRSRSLSDAGVQIIEKRAGNVYVLKAESAATLNTLNFVTDIRTYGVEETLGRQSESGLPRALQEYEAVAHVDADTAAIAQSISNLGGVITARDDRSIRFTPGQANIESVADLPGVASLQESSPPKLLNDAARELVGLRFDTGCMLDIGLDGSGQIVGIADTGIDDAHPDFADRIVGIETWGRAGDHSDPIGHGTHVAGTIAGSGAASNGILRGAAPGAKIFFQSLLDANSRLGGLPTDVGALFSTAYAAGVRVHNNSWGAFLEARYGSNSVQVDRFVHQNPLFLPVIAAGNSGRCHQGPDNLRNSKPGFVEYPSIATPASAKNGLTVGASRSSRTTGGFSRMTWRSMWSAEFPEDPIGSETISGNPEALAGFSSRGPVENDMLKPDLVAPGTDVASTKSSHAPLRNFWGAYPNNPAYGFMGGTSMAAPLVAGAAVLVRQYYCDKVGHEPSAALVKATLINGTAWLTDATAVAEPDGEPNYHQGFGRLDMLRTLPNASVPALRLRHVDTLSQAALDFTQTGQRHSWRLTTDGAGELRLCLAWTDFPASGLQNALILVVDEVGSPRKWTSNQRVPQAIKLPTTLAPNVTISRDPKNNVQSVRIPDGVVGEYVVSIIVSNILFPPQSFAMVATGMIRDFVQA